VQDDALDSAILTSV